MAKKTVDKRVAGLIKENSGIKLDIGCGHFKKKGCIGIDMLDLPDVDIVHDLEVFPWPLPDECVITAFCSHVIEHINPHKGVFMNFMDEVWRVCKPDAQFTIACPHGLSAGFLQDPTHCNAVNESTFLYFDPLEGTSGGQLYKIYKPRPWKIEYISFDPSANIEVILRKRRLDKSYE